MSNADFKRVLLFQRANNKVYLRLRGEITRYLETHSITNKRKTGDASWKTMMDWVLGHEYLRPAWKRYRDKGQDGAKEIREAVHFLCLSCVKSIYASQRVLERSLERAADDRHPTTTTGDTAAPAPPPVVTEDAPAPVVSTEKEVVRGRSIRVSLCDPDLYPEANTQSYPWSGDGIIKTSAAMLTEPSYQDLARACGKYLPAGRCLQEIRGAIGTPAESSETITLADDEEVVAWLLDTPDVHPLRVLAILKEATSTPRSTIISIHSPC